MRNAAALQLRPLPAPPLRLLNPPPTPHARILHDFVDLQDAGWLANLVCIAHEPKYVRAAKVAARAFDDDWHYVMADLIRGRIKRGGIL